MRIGEIAEKTGLSISNIRFYKKKGLIGPHREEESKYRNYSNADLERLNFIILYRKMDVSVEVIGKILDGKISSEDALEQQLIDLKLKQKTLQSSVDLCQKMIDDGAYGEIDINYYLDYVKEEESKGKVFWKIDDLIEDISNVTGFNHCVGGSYWGWRLLSNAGINRAVKAVWCAFFALVPIIGIIIDLMDGDGISSAMLTIWVLYIISLTFSFLGFRKTKK